ncbi:hypothetical protein AB9F26_05990 [Falsihalocynthiibacter sp. BN13B15]|uniref:hypothetical protein n=1 Tax=Falsihalocynthiibacter sp. BN13B15 TaxID=3240871 RepID=UPI00350FF6CD
MKLSIPVILASVTLISGCVTDTSDEVISDVPSNDARIVARTCLDAVAAHSGVARTDLFSNNYVSTSSGAQTTILNDPAGSPWECYTDGAGALVRIDGPAA